MSNSSGRPTQDYGEYLLKRFRKDPEEALLYLNVCLEEEEFPIFLRALKNVVDAGIGMSAVAKATDLHRVSLYKMLSDKGNPTLKSLEAVLDAVGLRLRIERKPQPAEEGRQDGA